MTADGDRLVTAQDLLRRLGLSDVNLEACGLVRHAYSHFGVRLHLHQGSAKGSAHPIPPWDTCERVILGDLDHYGLSGLTLKALEIAGKRDGSSD